MPQQKAFGAFIFDLLQTVVLALAVFLMVYLFLFQPHQVRGESMLPNFEDNEYLLTDKLSYRLGNPKRADVVVFAAPASPGEDYIKRIIGLPGEHVSIKNGKIHINGQPLGEPYLPADTYTQTGILLDEKKDMDLAGNEYFVLGDNRNNSSDSRRFGPVKRKKLVGRAWVVYWPPNKLGFIKYSP